MKLYLHYEEQPEFTLILRIEKNVVNDGRTKCLSENATVLQLKHLFVEEYKRSKGRELKNVDVVNSEKKVYSLDSLVIKEFKDKENVFFVNAAPTKEEKKPQPQPQSERKKEKTSNNIIGLEKLYEQDLIQAVELKSKGNYKAASIIFQKIQAIDPKNFVVLIQLGDIFLNAKKIDRALEYLVPLTQSQPQLIEAFILLGHAYFEKGDFRNAVESYSKALVLAKDKKDKSLINQLKVFIAKSLYESGEKSPAIQILQQILKEDEDCIPALYRYSIALIDQGYKIDAMRTLLKVLVANGNDKQVKETVSLILQEKGSLELLEKEIFNIDPKNIDTETKNTVAPALAFLATFVKDFGGVNESKYLFQRALEIRPESSSYCLNLVHVMEISLEYDEAIKLIHSFCRSNLSSSVASQISCQDVAQIIEKYSVSFQNQSASPSGVILSSPISELNNNNNNTEIQKSEKPKDLPENELDLFALFFTLVKVLYVRGDLAPLQPLISLLDPIRKGRDLHFTTIRNEHAYFCCISQLMNSHTDKNSIPKNPDVKLRPIYVAGDSHSISPAWHVISVKDEPRLLIPILVTGLKIWHLRPKSRFFPKINFLQAISSIPLNSDVIFLFGEIDCREGFPLCVQRCKYDTLEEGMNITINIYMDVLTKIIHERKFAAFIHPVVPVLNETRHIVKLFNRLLRSKVERVKEIKGVDFFDKLLTPDQGALKSCYYLDGTLLKQKNLEVLEESFKSLKKIVKKN
eukprot:TRINITY_DN7095_c0_g2_i1.p1 TRINITY_DN7095_c0_g2~~TRINITY_DN7095_c0_g2_i1.p1  ORF type:complete len:746 (-),score=166.86 TRINITY_DN7095_c0_g2_i1:30-2267(-)